MFRVVPAGQRSSPARGLEDVPLGDATSTLFVTMVSIECPTSPAGKLIPPTATHGANPELHLEIVRTEEGFLALENAWDGLLDQSAIRTPFLRWDWVSLWWKEYRDRFELAIGVIRDRDRQPRAIAPFVIGRDIRGARRYLRHLTFLGGLGDIMSEGMDLIIPAGMEPVCSPWLCRLIGDLRRDWDVAKLPMIAEESPNRANLFAALQRAGHGANVIERHVSRVVDLPACWQEMEARLSSNRRSAFRRKWRDLTQKCGGAALVAPPGVAGEALFERLLELHSMRWEGAESQFLGEAARRFHRSLVSRWWPQGRIVMPSLQIDGRPIAMTYNFVEDGKLWYYQAGRDPNLEHLSVGKLALGWSIKVAITMGLRQFDFLPGDSDIKRMWTDQVRHLEDLEGFGRASVRAWLFRAMRAMKRITGDRARVGRDEARGIARESDSRSGTSGP